MSRSSVVPVGDDDDDDLLWDEMYMKYLLLKILFLMQF